MTVLNGKVKNRAEMRKRSSTLEGRASAAEAAEPLFDRIGCFCRLTPLKADPH